MCTGHITNMPIGHFGNIGYTRIGPRTADADPVREVRTSFARTPRGRYGSQEATSLVV